MSKDITSILSGWEHDPDEFQVRIVAGDDGRDKLQMRVDLGVIQMEIDGRPDGVRPHGLDSLLDYYEAKAGKAGGDEFQLDSDDLRRLMREGVQYYHRYLASFHLQRFDLVARDTTRNLRLFAFAVKHAADRRDKVQFDQYRPYVTMMRARALSAEAMNRERAQRALEALDDGIDGIRAFLREYEQDEDRGQLPRAEQADPPPPRARAGQARRPGRAAGAAARPGRLARRLRGSRPDPRPDRPAQGGRPTPRSARSDAV